MIRAAKLWCDTESAAEVAELSASLDVPIVASYTASKLLWLKRSEPDAWARLAHLALPHDYLNLALTGALVMEGSDAGPGWLGAAHARAGRGGVRAHRRQGVHAAAAHRAGGAGGRAAGGGGRAARLAGGGVCLGRGGDNPMSAPAALRLRGARGHQPGTSGTPRGGGAGEGNRVGFRARLGEGRVGIG